jgi:hypothetical protein
VVISYFNNSSGNGIKINQSSFEIVGTAIKVENASANCINAASSKSVKWAGCSFKGASVPVSANVTQLITNTEDSQGNILI